MDVRRNELFSLMHLRSVLAPFCLFITLALFTAGCGTLNHRQYEIRPVMTVAGRPTVSVADTEALKEILRRSAARLNLEERTKSSLVPGTLVYFIAPDSSTPIKLIGWIQDGKMMVDLMHAPDGLGEDLRYRDEKERLWSALQEKFGPRAVSVPIRSTATVGTRYDR
jgi:hypothetical protein